MSEQSDVGFEEVREQLRVANGELHKYQALFKSEAWKELEEIWNEQIAARRDYFELQEGRGVDDLVKAEYIRGELAGLRLAVEHPRKVLEQLESTIEGLKEILKAEPEGDEDGEG